MHLLQAIENCVLSQGCAGSASRIDAGTWRYINALKKSINLMGCTVMVYVIIIYLLTEPVASWGEW